MKVAELKRKLVVGVKLDLVHFSGWTPGPRTISKVNTVGFYLMNSEGKESFCDWPKKDELVEKPNGFAIKSQWSWWEGHPNEGGTHKTGVVELLNYKFVS